MQIELEACSLTQSINLLNKCSSLFNYLSTLMLAVALMKFFYEKYLIGMWSQNGFPTLCDRWL